MTKQSDICVGGCTMMSGYEENCRILWCAYLMQMVSDAMYPFKIPSEKFPKIQKQLELLCAREYLGIPDSVQRHATNQAIYFLETSRFNSVVEMIGYDTEFVRRTFNLVQEAITAKKELTEFFKEKEKGKWHSPVKIKDSFPDDFNKFYGGKKSLRVSKNGDLMDGERVLFKVQP